VPTAASELHSLLAVPALAGVPLLVLANKNDLPEAMGVDEMISSMALERIRDRAVSVSARAMEFPLSATPTDNPPNKRLHCTIVLLDIQQDEAQLGPAYLLAHTTCSLSHLQPRKRVLLESAVDQTPLLHWDSFPSSIDDQHVVKRIIMM
jgi:hypothetical protein